MAQLKAYLSEVPAERFKSPMKVADIPRLFTPETFCKLVVQAQRDAKAAAESRQRDVAIISRPSRSSTGSPRSCPARARAARSRSPPRIAAFPPCLMAEAVGQLAAWVAMAHIGFRGRPVAALARETRFLRGARARDSVLDLAVEIESCDDEAVAYRRRADIDGERAIELTDCLGPMLPLAEFDDPGGDGGALRACCATAARRRVAFAASTLPRVSRDGGVPGTSADRDARGAVDARRFSTITFRGGRCFRRRCCSTRKSTSRLRVAAESLALAARYRARAGAHDARQGALVHAARQTHRASRAEMRPGGERRGDIHAVGASRGQDGGHGARR